MAARSPSRTSSPKAPRTRPRAAHLGPELRRPLILDVALRLFLEHGYKGTSMDAIAHCAGVSKPVVYDCFASKADLFGALLDREEQRMFEEFGAALVTGEGVGDLHARLIAGFTSMLRAVTATPSPYRVALMSGGDAEAAIADRVRRGRDRQIAAIAAIARDWLGGSLSGERLEGAAQFVGNTLVAIGEAGVRIMVSEPEHWTPEALARALADLAGSGYPSLLR